MNDFLTAARSLLEPWVIVMVVSCGSVIAAVLLSEARQRMNTRVDLERRNPYISADTEEARADMHRQADTWHAKRRAAERRLSDAQDRDRDGGDAA